ncbi:MAG: glycosyltransferase family 8 protein [Clostridia bacterium]|nr:glycosyltransferase family 8 protein [Clostridia bacterium]
MDKIIPIFFTIDDSYAPFLATALTSAIDNCSAERNYKAIVLYRELSEENRARLISLSTDNFTIECTPMQAGLESITDRMSNRLRCDYFTLTIYFRLFIPTMFPEFDKGIYIDSDVVLRGDLAELYDIDIGDNLIGACADRSVVEVPPLARYMENAVGVEKHSYINSGVLLMNLKKLREVELDRHFLTLLNTYHFDCIAPDQDYLNAICNGKIHYLDARWDAMPNEDQPPLSDAKLIHYNLFSKPWCYDNIQYGEYFWQYAKDSGYLSEIEAYKAAYSDEQKASDKKCLALLIERGDSIPAQDVTFKKMLESGVKIRL